MVDNAGAQITSISDKVETLDDIGQIKVMLEDLKAEAEDNSDSAELIEALSNVFDKQAKKIASLEAKLDRVIVETTINNKNNNNPSSKISKLYEKLKSDNSYTFTQTLDDENKMYYAKKEGKAYIDIFEDGQENKTIVTEGNTYLVNDDEKTYYIYNNNETDFNKIENQLSELKDMENKKGKEKIGNTTYYYEEYDSITELPYIFSFRKITFPTQRLL